MTGWQTGVAIYAAIVATGALFLEVRRWFEGRARLYVTASSGMKTINLSGTEDNHYMMVTVVNRGASSTTLTNLGLLEYSNFWNRLRRKSSRTAIVADPSIPGVAVGKLPDVLNPGGQWMGVVIEDEELHEWINMGCLYVAIYASHSNKPVLKRVSIKPKSLESTEER